MNDLTFYPSSPTAPALCVTTPDTGVGVLFQCISVTGAVESETSHLTLADALRQVTQRMDTDSAYAGRRLAYRAEV